MKKFVPAIILPVLAAALMFSSFTSARADVEDRLFDFTDAYYWQNGVDPSKIVGRRTGSDGRSVFDTPAFFYQLNVRPTGAIPAYGHNGSIHFFSVLGTLHASSFTNDAAGRRAQRIADSYIEYLFPNRTGNQISPGNVRQSAVLDLRNGYFGSNPLGLWLQVYITYTDRAFGTSDGRKMLADLERKNGLGLDGLPIVKTLSELDNLLSKGLVAKRSRKADGSEGTRYSICPVIEDPTDGGIAPDMTLGITRRPDGTPVEFEILRQFNSLQITGDWAR